MSYTTVPVPIRCRLWGKAAGRCQYLGCNVPLWIDTTTKAEINKSYIAHIVADKPEGPRGDLVRSPLLAKELSNLMLLCDPHHRLIDIEDVAGHSEERLLQMKATHERRMEIVGSADVERQSHVVLYGANVGTNAVQLTMQAATRAMLPEWYPAEASPIRLGMVNSTWADRAESFWKLEAENLRNLVNQQIRPKLKTQEITHLSLFGFAPQPLLMLLGALLTDIPRAEVYQLHREPAPGWDWSASSDSLEFIIDRPAARDSSKVPALVFAISANVLDDRVERVLPHAAIWRVRVAKPHNDVLQTREHLSAFRNVVRPLLDELRDAHPNASRLHVFPAMPVAAAVEFGRVLMPKAQLPILAYDQNLSLGGFVRALDLHELTERSAV